MKNSEHFRSAANILIPVSGMLLTTLLVLYLTFGSKNPSFEKKLETVYTETRNFPTKVQYQGREVGSIMSSDNPKRIELEYSLESPKRKGSRDWVYIIDNAPFGLGVEDKVYLRERDGTQLEGRILDEEEFMPEQIITLKQEYPTLVNQVYQDLPKKD